MAPKNTIIIKRLLIPGPVFPKGRRESSMKPKTASIPMMIRLTTVAPSMKRNVLARLFIYFSPNSSFLRVSPRAFPSTGFVKIIAYQNGVLLGASIVAPRAGEMIHELGLAVQNHLTAEDIAHTIHAFPTWSEAVRIAAAKIA